MNAWNTFNGGAWQNEINVRDFIQKNYTPYDGDGAFLAPATGRTVKMREKFDALLAEERDKGGVRNVDTETVITITAFGPGYLDKDNEIIVGLQTDEPLKRACNPFGGMRMVREACKAYGYEVSPKIEEEFKYHKTHNDGVFSAYTRDVREARHVGLLTGLPDAYGRGRIIGDYRRVALYGVDPVVHDLFFHVLKIHAPDIVFVFYQRAVDDVVAVVLQAVGETDVGGGVQQDIVSAGAENVQRADNAAQHAVFIADALLCQAGDAVARFVPADDGSKIFLRGRKIAVGRMPGAGDDGLGNGGHGGEVHIRHPHGNGVEALLRSAGCEAGRAQCIHGDGVFAAAVHDTGKIVFHRLLLLSPAGTGVENTAVKQLKC